jgi:hypothetical protein
MSVYRLEVIESQGGVAARVLIGHEGFALAALTAGQFRSQSQTVFPNPLPAESSHAKICGLKPKKTRRWFAAQSVWVDGPQLRNEPAVRRL